MAQADIKRILIFDDDAEFRKLLVTRLGKQFEGVELEEYDPVANGIPGKGFDWSRYDVLLLDYKLQTYGVTGLDILQSNRKNPAFPAAIMLTGEGNEEVAVRALKAGVYDYLRKDKLDKEKLRDAIIEAHEKQLTEVERLNDLTRHSHAFNKALFYQKLEGKHESSDAQPRVLLVISLDEHQLIEELAGLIMRDNFIRYIARQSYDIFRLAGSNPNITRLSDTSVALLIDEPASGETLRKNLQTVCDHFKEHPFQYDGKTYHFTVSIGAVRLSSHAGPAEEVINAARNCCLVAEKTEGNSFHIFSGEQESAESAPEAKPAAKPETPRPGAETTPGEAPAAAAEPQESEPAPAAAEAEPAKTGSPAPEHGEAPAAEEPQSDETAAEADTSGLGAVEIVQAFKDNRITQTFQPIISLMENDEGSQGNAAYYVSLQMLNKDNETVGADEILAALNADLQKNLDRWMLRETIGRIVNGDGDYLFILHLGRASIADATLFNWLRKLLSGVEAKQPGRSLALEIGSGDFAALQKPATALITYLKKTHGFKFVLGNIRPDDDLAALCGNGQFDLFRLDQQLLGSLSGDGDSVISTLKDKGLRVIADNIDDAMALTATIGSGADLAMGPFIGEPAEQLEDQDYLESLEIV